MEWLVSLAPVLTPVCGMAGALGGAWLMHRQAKRKNDAEASTAAISTVTEGFTGLLEQQRAMNAQTLDRVTTLEARQIDLERKVEVLQEEQRRWRRWKAAAVDYVRQLRALLAPVGPVPAPPREIAADIDDSTST
ncbi:hypothetical protein ACQEVS_09745 [Streptomyces sp. CA-181903]|uniref:hypothetical protein n=1 Tax=Streptomyces sp. CA-181903 TaxID=3240055 RepID=UPI003D8F692A